MSPTPDSPPPAIDGLQFEKVEIASRTCAVCTKAIPAEYFQVNGAEVCPACTEAIRAQQGRATTGGLLRGVLFGLGAALVCAAGYGLFTYLTGFEFGLIAIAVGWLVGRAVRVGAHGMGGRRCQIAALLLTYLAITMGYVPLIYKGILDRAKAEDAKILKETEAKLRDVKPVGLHLQSEPNKPVVAIVSMVMALVLPFASLTEGISGVLGIIILGVGLHQAWKTTARVEHTIEGPLGAAEGVTPGA